MFRKILIANRGEIALRVLRTCREMGIPTVAVHSTIDRDSAVVNQADESVQIGPPPAKRSYLNAAAILAAAERTGADAIHPGYGFLSESADFAVACGQSGVTLIGPPGEVMERLGDKQSARAMMAEIGLPLLPGSVRPLEAEQAKELADDIGYPVIVKAAAGGGGLGMTIVRDPARFLTDFQQTRTTARMLFGDGRVYVEKYLDQARHVEIQVLCDTFGSGVHLGERDCTVQRRRQKLVEESPAPGLPRDLIDRMGKSAVDGALAAGYVGAGTFEFLVDPDGGYYFMEVNCRIQVEHPVTEMVTHMDLVAEQIRVAAGEPLTVDQESINPRGVAIECRVNAENPEAGFTPAPGRVDEFVAPGGPFVRVDSHLFPGYAIPPNYDSLLAKLIVWAPDRDAAIARMDRALSEFRIRGAGVHTTVDFARRVLASARFRAGTHTTDLVAELTSQE